MLRGVPYFITDTNEHHSIGLMFSMSLCLTFYLHSSKTFIHGFKFGNMQDLLNVCFLSDLNFTEFHSCHTHLSWIHKSH